MVLDFVDADTTQKATGATSAQIDFVCVICTSNSSTAAVASLSLPLCVCLCSRVPHNDIAIYTSAQIQTSYVYYVPVVVLLLLLPIFLSLFLSVSLFRGTSHNIAISVPTLLFFRSYNEVFVQTAFIAYFPSGKYYFAM